MTVVLNKNYLIKGKTMKERDIEELLLCGLVHSLKIQRNLELESAKKYSQDETAPAHHGLSVKLPTGEQFEILIIGKDEKK